VYTSNLAELNGKLLLKKSSCVHYIGEMFEKVSLGHRVTHNSCWIRNFYLDIWNALKKFGTFILVLM
jgi:hypothetical protein